MKSFLIAGTLIAIAALLNCGGNNSNPASGFSPLSVAADGSCTPRLEKDLDRYLESCQDFSGDVDLHPEKLKKLVDACNLLTQAHDEGVVCNLTHNLPNIDDSAVRECLKLDDDQTAPTGQFVLKLKGLHEKCAKDVSQYSELLSKGALGYSEARDPHRSHISHRTDGDGD